MPPGTPRAHKPASNDPLIGHAAYSIPPSPFRQTQHVIAAIQQAMIEILPPQDILSEMPRGSRQLRTRPKNHSSARSKLTCGRLPCQGSVQKNTFLIKPKEENLTTHTWKIKLAKAGNYIKKCLSGVIQFTGTT